MTNVKADFLFELSWEVCNKVGGIYTVIKSKAGLIKDAYSEYFLIGPYIKEQALEVFVEEDAPVKLKQVFVALEKEGIKCHFGTWQITPQPKVILIDIDGFANKKNDFKKYYWDCYKIDSLKSEWTFDEPLVWSTAAGKIVEKYAEYTQNKKGVIHCHEWMAGFALLYLKSKKIKIGTVFTTHATMLGRTICGAGVNLYDILGRIDPVAEAYKYGIQDKFLTEKACAQTADVFTTVSEITSMETEKLLGRKADVLLLNGLDIEKFPSFEETSVMHREHREKIREFVAYYFFPYYFFDLDETLLFFIVGRYEYKNKGIDIFIKSLAKLNNKLREESSKKTIVAFFWIPREVHGAKIELSQSKINYFRIRNFLKDNNESIQRKVIQTLIGCDMAFFNKPEFSAPGLFSQEFTLEAKQLRLSFARKGNPALVTHNLPQEENDDIIKGFLQHGLGNKMDDKVKVIFYPVYLTGVDGLIDLPYYDAITGCHLGLFPSYYEPWGYTPLECAALGVPSLTTDLGGFGRFIMGKGTVNEGVYILKRYNVSEEESVNHFYELMYNYTLLNEKGRVKQKMLAKEIANMADWEEFVNYYFEAHNKAVDKIWLS